MKLLVRGFVCCVLATGARAQWYSPASNVTVVYSPPVQTARVVVIVPVENWEQYEPARQITYLIAFKDSVIRMVQQYWVDGKTIHYVTTDHQLMTAPLSNVDRTLSQRLNSENDVAFGLPAEQVRNVVRARVVRHTAASARTRCSCPPARSAHAPAPASGGASRLDPGAPVSR